jgi:uncharacterized protein
LRRSISIAFVTCVLVLVAVDVAAAGSYEDGLAADRRGEHLEALHLFREAADRGDAQAQFNLGRMFSHGEGVPVDYGAALSWYRKAASQGNAGAQFSLGLMYQLGQGVPRDIAEAMGWYLKAAQQGYASAQVNLAAIYSKGSDAPENDAAAAMWYRKAAEQGDAEGEFSLGLIYAAPRHAREAALGMPQDRFHAVMNSVFGAGQWRETGGYRSPARENQLRAEGAETVPAGVISLHSRGTPNAPEAYDITVDGMSPDEAASRLRRSGVVFRRLFPETSHGTQGPHLHIEPGLTGLQEARVQRPRDEVQDRSDGGVRAEGDLVADGSNPAQIPEQNFAEAAVWFLKAAVQGNAGAQFNLGLLYQNGHGVPRDAGLAVHWYRAAAGQGNAGAQINLGVMYAKGDGVPQNDMEAIK